MPGYYYNTAFVSEEESKWLEKLKKEAPYDSDMSFRLWRYRYRKAQAKDSDTIISERVDLIKTIDNEKNNLLIFGYIRENATNPYKLYIPSSIIEYIILYRWFMPEWEKEEVMKRKAEEEMRRIMEQEEQRRLQQSGQ